MSTIVVALVLLAAGSFALKAAGPIAAAGRSLPPRLQVFAELLPAAMLAALVATQTLASGTVLALDARVVGVGAAAVAVVARAPFPVVVLVGAGVTALSRLAGMA